MEKLIELLNEWYQERYETSTRFDKFENYGGNDYWYFQSNDKEHFMYETDVWTKKYWFIKRLVESGKIHREKIPAVIKVDWYLADGSDTEYYNMEESLLMLLSISENPIDFLISILE